LKAAARKERNLRSFVGAKQTVSWETSYFVIPTFLLGAATWKRFSLPQYPLADTDYGYLWPAFMKLTGVPFAHIQGPKLSLSRLGLSNLANLAGPSSNLGDPTFTWLDRRGFVSRQLEQTC